MVMIWIIMDAVFVCIIIIINLGDSVHEGVAGDECTWCNELTLQSCNNHLTDPLNWKLVRAIGSPRNKWFPNRDYLHGTDDYADNGMLSIL